MEKIGTVSFELYYVTDGQGRHYAFSQPDGSLHSDIANETGQYQGARATGAVTNSQSFAEGRLTAATAPGLSFFRNRVYDQTTGRWTQEDPIGIAGGLNLYQFNGNDPVSFSDPFGLMTCPPDCGAIHTFGAVAFGALGALGGGVVASVAGPPGTVLGTVGGAAEGAVVGVAAANLAEDAAEAVVLGMATVGDWIKRIKVAVVLGAAGARPGRSSGAENDPVIEQTVPAVPSPTNPEKKKDDGE